MIVSPQFWEWFNIWLIQFLKDLYHEIKMVALRGTNTSLNTLPHACISHGNRPQQSAIDAAQSLQTSMNMPQSAVTQHINANQMNYQSLNNISLQFIPQATNPSSVKHNQHQHHPHQHHQHHLHQHHQHHTHEHTTSRYSNSNCMRPSHHQYRLLSQASK